MLNFIWFFVFSSGAFAADLHVKWSEGEHLELGLHGSAEACMELGFGKDCPATKNIPRRDGKVSFSYGELITSADYYLMPTDMYKDRRAGIKRVIKCAHKQMHFHGEQEETGSENYPGCTLEGIVGMPGYLEVVSKNYAHFGWNNMLAYVKYHGLALQKARASFLARKTDPTASRHLLHQALIANAFADHYLSDAFASGHIRVPRAQVARWAEARLRVLVKGKRGDLLTMLLHDRESISLKTQKEEGLLVQNSAGDRWYTRGDSHLHLKSYPNDPVREIPEQAIKESVKEVLVAWSTGELPEDIYSATLYVPFYKGVPLAEKLSAKFQGMRQSDFIKAFYSGIPFYERLLHRKRDLEKMLKELPSIFGVFRKDVARDLENNPELRLRLPAPYIEAFSAVH